MSYNRIIFILVDGFGIPPEGLNKSFLKKFSPEFIKLISENSVPVNVDMSMSGLPQSATGQSALFTGLNTARIMQRHIQGFPGPILKEIIIKRNIFKHLVEKGLSPAFVNAYVRFNAKYENLKSVTTVMTESVLKFFRDSNYLFDNQAIYHDITRETLKLSGHKCNIIKPEVAAQHLLEISKKYDFTLFEYFLTDRAGHKRDIEKVKKYFHEFGRFVVELSKNIGKSFSLILTSDHGNIEDISVPTHTRNPVPLMGLNFNLPNVKEIRIYEIFNLIVNNFENSNA